MFIVLLLFAAAVVESRGDLLASQPRNIATSSYILYTDERPHNGQSILFTASGVLSLGIKSSANCAIIVHGANDRGSGLMSTVVRDALLASGTTNVIIVDWTGGDVEESAIFALEPVAKNVVELIRLLIIYNKVSSARLHLIGFDVGAHIVGIIGRTSTYTIARITGLNPAKFLEGKPIALRRGDANYVEVIHTETSIHGVLSGMANVDFYPNGGKEQPGCANDTACSHNRAWELFAASLTHGRVIGNRCSSLSQAISDDACTGYTLALGTNDWVKYGSGLYRFETTEVYPYRCLVKCGLVDSIIAAIEKLGK